MAIRPSSFGQSPGEQWHKRKSRDVDFSVDNAQLAPEPLRAPGLPNEGPPVSGMGAPAPAPMTSRVNARSRLPAIQPAADFEDVPDQGWLSPDRFLSPTAPFATNANKASGVDRGEIAQDVADDHASKRPDLTPSQFSALGGDPKDYAAMQARLAALPRSGGQPTPPPPSIDMDAVSRDSTTDMPWNSPRVWGGSAALGAAAALGPGAAQVGGLGTAGNALARAGIGALSGAGGSALAGQPVGAGALTGAVLGPGLEDAASAGGGALRGLLSRAAPVVPTVDDATQIAKTAIGPARTPTQVSDTQLLNFPVRDPSPAARSLTQNIRPPALPQNVGRPPITPPGADEFPVFGELSSARSPAAPPVQAPIQLAPPPPAQGGSLRGGGGFLEQVGGALRDPRVRAAMLASFGLGAGGAAGLGGMGGGAASAGPIEVRDPVPYVTPSPYATPSARFEHLEPVETYASPEEVEMLQPILQSSGMSQQDYARGFAAKDGVNLDEATPEQRERYMIEAAQFFEPIAPAGPLGGGKTKPSMFGGLENAARGLDKALKGR